MAKHDDSNEAIRRDLSDEQLIHLAGGADHVLQFASGGPSLYADWLQRQAALQAAKASPTPGVGNGGGMYEKFMANQPHRI